MILKDRFDNSLRPRHILLLVCCSLRIVNTVLVECFNVFVDVSEDSIEVKDDQKLQATITSKQ